MASKNRLARNVQVMQVFFLQDLQDLELNLATYLASLALKIKLFPRGPQRVILFLEVCRVPLRGLRR